jgi:hypothetical protein
MLSGTTFFCRAIGPLVDGFAGFTEVCGLGDFEFFFGVVMRLPRVGMDAGRTDILEQEPRREKMLCREQSNLTGEGDGNGTILGLGW